MNRPKSNKIINACALLLSMTISLTLFGCDIFIPYQPNVQQGNIITPEMVSQLKLGMTPDQVKTAMGGAPVLVDTFSDDGMTYFYTYRPGKGKMTTKKVILTFENKKLTHIETDPESITKQTPPKQSH